jgi:hypothetical protein
MSSVRGGDLPTAEAFARKAVEAAGSLQSPVDLARATAFLGQIVVDLGQREEGKELLLRALATADDNNDEARGVRCSAYEWLTRIAIANEDLHGAENWGRKLLISMAGLAEPEEGLSRRIADLLAQIPELSSKAQTLLSRAAVNSDGDLGVTPRNHK